MVGGMGGVGGLAGRLQVGRLEDEQALVYGFARNPALILCV